MQNREENKHLKIEWIKRNIVQIVISIIAMLGCYVAAVFTHCFALVLVGIIIGFSLYFIGRNKMISYVEQNENTQ